MVASAFAIVFGLFVGALVVLCGVIITWAIRRDRTNWRQWRDRQGR